MAGDPTLAEGQQAARADAAGAYSDILKRVLREGLARIPSLSGDDAFHCDSVITAIAATCELAALAERARIAEIMDLPEVSGAPAAALGWRMRQAWIMAKSGAVSLEAARGALEIAICEPLDSPRRAAPPPDY